MNKPVVGIFSKDYMDSIKKSPAGYRAECSRCGLYRYVNKPRMEYSGKGKRKILIVGEAPGGDEEYRQFHPIIEPHCVPPLISL